MDRPQMQGAGRAAVTPANAVVLVLGALAIVGTLFWAMHEDARHGQQRARMAQQALLLQQQQPQASAEQRRHGAAQFVCGHGVAYQWVNANTVECLREAAADNRPVAVTSSGR